MTVESYLPEWDVSGVLRAFDGFGIPTNPDELRRSGCLVLGNRADPIRVLSLLANKLAKLGDAKRNRQFVALRDKYLATQRKKV
ncbi:MAG: hypothetical protein QOC72_3955 [Methylobacteriaceae bacterium]|jgi:hypothetical protein|nr:hypothetical protein [Methylobacteriaceae bacterium]